MGFEFDEHEYGYVQPDFLCIQDTSATDNYACVLKFFDPSPAWRMAQAYRFSDFADWFVGIALQHPQYP